MGTIARTGDLRLAADVDAPRQARAALADLGLASIQLDDLCFLVSELVSFCVLDPDRQTPEIGVVVTVEDRLVRAEVACRTGLECSSPCSPPDARRGVFDRLTQRWGVIGAGSCGVWVELHRDIALEHSECRAGLLDGCVAMHERAAAAHLRTARSHRRMAAACSARGDGTGAEREQKRAEAAQHRGEAELFRMRRSRIAG